MCTHNHHDTLLLLTTALSPDQSLMSVRTIHCSSRKEGLKGRNAGCCHPEVIRYLERDRVTLYNRVSEARRRWGVSGKNPSGF